MSGASQQGDGYNYVRRRGQNGTYTYTHSMVRASTSAEGAKGTEHVRLHTHTPTCTRFCPRLTVHVCR